MFFCSCRSETFNLLRRFESSALLRRVVVLCPLKQIDNSLSFTSFSQASRLSLGPQASLPPSSSLKACRLILHITCLEFDHVEGQRFYQFVTHLQIPLRLMLENIWPGNRAGTGLGAFNSNLLGIHALNQVYFG
ncbi:uncharacterized protein LOC130948779 [Arachis stenosperma]|uniref:uncharacterized protein LOC130948779 n=1 Tax=Arachis stenosperma TaxID=217475 RepID=UPI0025AC83F3|nr:uncharacterized protein LOC130948779 [Arachis stenosperma]